MMRRNEILREAWRNVQSGAAKAGWLSLALILAITLSSWAEVWSVAALTDRAMDYHDAGASVRILKTESNVDPQRCDALAQTNGIQSAGAITPSPGIVMASIPGVVTPAFETTPGFPTVLGLETTLDQGVLISKPLAERWKIRPGDTLETDQGPMRVAAVFPFTETDGRDSRLANAVLIPTLEHRRFEECWADVWPSTAAFDTLLRASQNPGANDSAATVVTLNTTLGLVFSGADEYQNRLSRFAPLFSAVLGLVIGLVGCTRRRLEYAFSLHAGVASFDLTLIALTESAAWAGVGGLSAVAGILLTTQIVAPLIANALYGQVLTIGAAGILGAITGSLLVSAYSREARLFTYFKERN
ncbi:hypothetical protein [Paenarthrobacter sp. NCHU4564]|uniref:hypothetical protein n=1 Tax=Paenarthrobacter sp. NCHU4564 TaxID=3451353 RepID=UPI003F9477B1